MLQIADILTYFAGHIWCNILKILYDFLLIGGSLFFYDR